MELDPGFTWQGFGAHAAVEAIAAFFGTLGAFVVALVIYSKTRDDQRAIFREEIESELKQRRGEARAHRDSIQLALRFEMDDNLDTLREFRARIVSADENENNPVQVAERLAIVSIPVWGTSIWQGAAATVTVALNRDELTRARRIYKTLSDIQVTQGRLEVAQSSDDADYAAQPESPSVIRGLPGHKFRRDVHFPSAANALIPNLRERIDAALEQGNPVKPENAEAEVTY